MLSIKPKISGFSLIELMVVIAIVAVLSAIAVPSYKNYTAKAKISSSMSIFDKFKTEEMLTFSKTGTFSFTNAWLPLNIGVISNYGLYSGSIQNLVYIHLQLISNVYPGQTNPVWLLMQLQANSNGTFSSICGVDSRAPYQIPLEYMPAGCKNIITMQF